MSGRAAATKGRRLRSLSRLQLRLTLGVVVVVGLIVNAAHFVLDAHDEAARMAAIRDGSVALVRPSAARAAYTFDMTLAETVVRTLTDLGSVTAARLDGEYGAPLVTREEPRAGSRWRWLTDLLFGPEMVVAARLDAPQALGGGQIGTLTVHFDTNALAQGFLSRSLWLVGLGLLKTAVIAAVLSVVFYALVTRPVMQLAERLDAVDPGGEAPLPASALGSPGRQDELGRLAEAIAALLARSATAEAARAASDRSLKSAARCLPDGLAMLDTQGRLVLENARFRDVIPEALSRNLRPGGVLADALRRAAAEEPLFHEDMGPDALEADLALVARGQRDDDIRLADGRTLRIRMSPNPDGGSVILLSDVTRRRWMEEELRRTEKLSALGTLAGGVAHDFNNLLATISTSAELAGARLEAAGGDAAPMDRIREACRRGRSLIEQVTSFNRAARLPSEPIDLGAATATAIGLIEPALGGAVVETRLPEAPVIILANDAQVHQVVSNLVTNAAQAAGPRGQVCVRVEAGVQDARLVVEDDGPGMDAATRRRALEPFFTTKDVGEGTGLGLSVVWGTVSEMGGRVEITAAPGRGTRVTVTVPRVPQQLKHGCFPHGTRPTPG